jgi:ESCRT-I complex subunit VPS28
MLKLVGDDVPSIEQFMSRYRVSNINHIRRHPLPCRSTHIIRLSQKMDLPAALHRLQVGVPATVEHSSEAGPETGKWVAETTQVWLLSDAYIG